MKKEINNEAVRNYWIEKYDSGIICLTINTVERWVTYHRYSNDEYNISTPTNTSDRGYRFTIKELKIPNNYLCVDNQDKDQISFYWIPYELITKGKIKERIKAKRNANKKC